MQIVLYLYCQYSVDTLYLFTLVCPIIGFYDPHYYGSYPIGKSFLGTSIVRRLCFELFSRFINSLIILALQNHNHQN